MTRPNCSPLLIAAMLAVAPLQTAEAGYLGVWTITRAAIAPWADPTHPLDRSEPSRLKGKTVTFKAGGISGPQPLACPKAHYELTDFTPDLLFQGTFDEMRSKDHRIDPAKLSAALGFKGARIRTLETGCEFDFHFVDESTATFGLNDYVYYMIRK